MAEEENGGTRSGVDNKEKKQKKERSDNDWINSLVQQVVTEDDRSHPKQRPSMTKEERIAKRASQKAQRQEQKVHQQQQRQQSQQQQQQKQSLQRTSLSSAHHRHEGESVVAQQPQQQRQLESKKKKEGEENDDIVSSSNQTRLQLKLIAQWILIARREHEESIREGRRRKQQQELETTTDETVESTTETTTAKKNKKRMDHPEPSFPIEDPHRVKRIRPLNEMNIQPRPSDYSGIGFARKSLYLPFQDPSHIPRLTQEFNEHIPGFYGRQRTKAMKKQLDGNMLWRTLVREKEQHAQEGGATANGTNQKKSILSKKLAKLSPDERVQAMIDAGMI